MKHHSLVLHPSEWYNRNTAGPRHDYRLQLNSLHKIQRTLLVKERERIFLQRRIRNKQLKNYHTIKTSILTNGLALLLLQYTKEIGSMARDLNSYLIRSFVFTRVDVYVDFLDFIEEL